jgi:hypothetical protein
MFYNIKTWHTTVNYNNQGSINMSERNLRRNRPGSSCADILQKIINTRNNVITKVKYQHVNGHMDKYLVWHQLSMEQKMNVICNNLKKCAVAREIRSGMRREKNSCSPVKTQWCS